MNVKTVILAILVVGICSLCGTVEAKKRKRSQAKLDLLPDEKLCARKRCGRKPKGSWCQIVRDENGHRTPTCVCPRSCNTTHIEPVCSMYGRQYDSECLMHLEACKKRKNIKLAYEGACIASQAKCQSHELQQFPFRLLDWFVHLKDVDEFGSVDYQKTVMSLSESDRRAVAQWKFQHLDRNKDGKLSNKEIKRFRFALMPLEHCAKHFFKKCDLDKNRKLSSDEWSECLVTRALTWYQGRLEVNREESIQ
ncbi:SPARC isoform X2 [Ciona intestinalis]